MTRGRRSTTQATPPSLGCQIALVSGRGGVVCACRVLEPQQPIGPERRRAQVVGPLRHDASRPLGRLVASLRDIRARLGRPLHRDVVPPTRHLCRRVDWKRPHPLGSLAGLDVDHPRPRLPEHPVRLGGGGKTLETSDESTQPCEAVVGEHRRQAAPRVEAAVFQTTSCIDCGEPSPFAALAGEAMKDAPPESLPEPPTGRGEVLKLGSEDQERRLEVTLCVGPGGAGAEAPVRQAYQRTGP